jgi:hypothetical protein
MGAGLCGPDPLAVRLPPPFLVLGLCREFRVESANFGGILRGRGWVVSCFMSEVLIFSLVACFSR